MNDINSNSKWALRRTVVSLLLSFVLAMTILAPSPVSAIGKAGQYVSVNSAFNLRSGPSTGDDWVATLYSGERVRILDVVEGGNTSAGNIWYKVQWRNRTLYLAAWDHKQRIEEDGPQPRPAPDFDDTSITPEWAEVLNTFPPSYRYRLTELHKKYPRWNFVPDPISHSLYETLRGELDREDRNLVPRYDSYSYYIKNHTVYDAGGWVPINDNGLAYLMDPRNYLNERDIFAFEDNRTPSSSDKTIRHMFEGNPGLLRMIPYIQKAAKKYGVSDVYLAARIKGEVSEDGDVIDSADGTRVVDGRSGTYNVFNIGAYAGKSPRDNAIRYARGEYHQDPSDKDDYVRYMFPWDSLEKAVMGGTLWIYDYYLDNYQYTSYYQKFDVRNGLRYHQYMQNAFAPRHDASSKYDGYVEASDLSSSKTFYVPVYRDTVPAIAQHPSQASSSWWNQSPEKWTRVTGARPTPKPTPKPTPVPTPTPTPKPTPKLTPVPTARPVPTKAPDHKQSREPQSTVLGDANGDGEVDIRDILIVVNHITEEKLMDAEAIRRSDLNEDGEIDIRDIQKIVHIIEES